MMNDPMRSRNRAAAVLAVSVALLVTARALPDASVGHGLHLALSLAGTIGAPISAIWMLVSWVDGKRYRRLKAGIGVIARWNVDGRRWEEFRGQSKGWDKREGVRPNLVNLDQTPGPAGIEIVVTRDAILVGNDFTPVEMNVAIMPYPDWLDLYYVIPKPKGSPFHVNLRIPLAPAPGGAQQAAQIVEAYRIARTAKTAMSFTKTKFLVVFLGGFFALTGLLIALVYLLKRGP